MLGHQTFHHATSEPLDDIARPFLHADLHLAHPPADFDVAGEGDDAVGIDHMLLLPQSLGSPSNDLQRMNDQ